ncbi:hypothetical protein HYU12_01505 [Candidatus Woesearchaeota archaeon]|nr:hypothetical protein [Candidatus Woesearchaeota archaeon]
MTQASKKVEWCLNKVVNDLKETGKHRGLVMVKADLDKAKDFVSKAEHYLKATEYLKRGDFSDISASTVFYSMYHCLLAIAEKFGYESRNQDCTFALIHGLIEDGKIDFDMNLLNKIASLDVKQEHEKTSIEIREQFQYGIELSIKDDLYKELVNLAKEVIVRTKEILNRYNS